MQTSRQSVFTILLISATLLILQVFSTSVNAQIYRVGPNEAYRNLGQINWGSLQPGDLVEILFRSNPYKEKIFILSSGTKDRPITIKGISNSEGKKPVIEGGSAIQSQDLNNEGLSKRGLIIVGEENKSADFVNIENLELRNANNVSSFFLKKRSLNYASNAAGVFVRKSKYLKIKNCIIHSCCVGVQTSYYPSVDKFILTDSVIQNNGDFTRNRWSHNVYLCARITLVQFNRFGELYSDGNNIKDRSNNTIIRYNWIQGGMSRQIDLVEYKGYARADAFVYGNVIVSGEKTKNPKMILFGGDRSNENGKLIGPGRNGTLYFFNNTVHFRKKHLDAFLNINRLGCKVFFQNNLMLGGTRIWMGPGWLFGSNNLVPYGTNDNGLNNTLYGGYEHVSRKGKNPYLPTRNSLAVNRGTSQIPIKVKYMPKPASGGVRRPENGRMDIGAFEFTPVFHKKQKE